MSVNIINYNPKTHCLVVKGFTNNKYFSDYKDIYAHNPIFRKRFKYPTSGTVVCPDWNPYPSCGNGLHGWKNGQGKRDSVFWKTEFSKRDYWMVLLVSKSKKNLIELDGKLKFHKGEVVFTGNYEDMRKFVMVNQIVNDDQITPKNNFVAK